MTNENTRPIINSWSPTANPTSHIGRVTGRSGFCSIARSLGKGVGRGAFPKRYGCDFLSQNLTGNYPGVSKSGNWSETLGIRSHRHCYENRPRPTHRRGNPCGCPSPIPRHHPSFRRRPESMLRTLLARATPIFIPGGEGGNPHEYSGKGTSPRTPTFTSATLNSYFDPALAARGCAAR